MNEEDRKHLSLAMKVSMLDPEHRKQNSETLKRVWQDPIHRLIMTRKMSKNYKRKWEDPEYRAKMSRLHKELWQNLEYRAKMSQLRRQLWQNPKHREKMAQAMEGITKRNWQNPDFVMKVMEGLRTRPTNPERKLITIIDKYFPQFEYNGDFSLGITLNGLVPDFVNINGEKEVIEVFGDYWHSPEDVLPKTSRYRACGYKCLIIWENELNNMPNGEIADKIFKFFSYEEVQ